MGMIENIASLRADQRFADTDHWATFGVQWASGETKRIECLTVVDETHDVKTFVFHCPDYHALAYEPGQFLTVSPVVNGESISRCYTLSSTPTRPFTSTAVMALRCHPCEPCSLRTFSSLAPDILPPMRPSRSSTTLYLGTVPPCGCVPGPRARTLQDSMVLPPFRQPGRFPPVGPVFAPQERPERRKHRRTSAV